MSALATLLCLLSTPASAQTGDGYYQGYLDGRLEARERCMLGPLALGAAAGCAGVACVVVPAGPMVASAPAMALSLREPPLPEALNIDTHTAYINGYTQGYQHLLLTTRRN